MIVEIRHDNWRFTLSSERHDGRRSESSEAPRAKRNRSYHWHNEVLVLVIIDYFLHEDGNGHVDLSAFRRKLKKVASSRWKRVCVNFELYLMIYILITVF
jgi:hypothetical protein